MLFRSILESKFSSDNAKTIKELLELKSQQLEILEKQDLFNNQTKVGLNAVDKYLESKFKESQRMMQTSYDEVRKFLVILYFIIIYFILSDINVSYFSSLSFVPSITLSLSIIIFVSFLPFLFFHSFLFTSSLHSPILIPSFLFLSINRISAI